MIRSDFPERTGKHFICCCNRQAPGSSDHSVAHAVLQHTKNILELSQEQLSAEAHLSTASVSRFFRRCGFESFQQFKHQLAQFFAERRLRQIRHLLTAFHGKNAQAMAQQLYQEAAVNLQCTMEQLDLDLLRQAVKKIQNSRTVYFVGDNRDMHCFYSLQLDLLCNGQAAYFYNIDDISEHTLPQMDRSTTILLLSVNSFWFHEEMALLCAAARREHAFAILFSQEKPYAQVEPDLCCLYGQAGSFNNGYYSLMLLAKLLSTMFYT